MWKRHSFRNHRTSIYSPLKNIRRPLGFLIISGGIKVCYFFKSVFSYQWLPGNLYKYFAFTLKTKKLQKVWRFFAVNIFLPTVVFQIFWNTTKSNTVKDNFLVICELLKHKDYVEHLAISASLISFVSNQFINALMHNAPMWSDTLLKSCSICCKILKCVCPFWDIMH